MTGLAWNIPTKSDLKKLKLKRLVIQNSAVIENLLDEIGSLYKKDAPILDFVAPISTFLHASKAFTDSLKKSAPKFCNDFKEDFHDPIEKIGKHLESISKYPNDIEKLLNAAEKNFDSLSKILANQLDDSVLKAAIDFLFIANNGIGTVGSLCLELGDETGIKKYQGASVTLKKLEKSVSTIDKILVISKDKKAYNFDTTNLLKAVGDCLSMTQTLKKDLKV